MIDGDARTMAGHVRQKHRHCASRFFSRPLWNEREKAARIVHHDAVEHVLVRAGRFQLRNEHGQGLGIAAGSVGRKHQMIGKTGIDERHDHGYLLRVVISTLTVETDKCTTSADRFMYIHVRVYKVPHVSDNDVLRAYTSVLEDIQLFERRLAGNSRVREDRDVRRNMCFANGAEYFAFSGGDFVPRANFAERAENVVVRPA